MTMDGSASLRWPVELFRTKWARGLLTIACVAFLAILIHPARCGDDPLTVPEKDETVTLSPKLASRLGLYFNPALGIRLLSLKAQQMLLRGAPAGWTAFCEAKINGWGAAAKGTTRLSVRIVARTSPDEVWLSVAALACWIFADTTVNGWFCSRLRTGRYGIRS